MLDQRFAGMKEALENATDADRAAINEMLTDLNDLLAKHARGEDTPEDFADFMDKHGEFFPENPQNVDELIDAIAERAAAAQRMMNSMTAEQRAELMSLAEQAFGSPELMQQLAQLDANLQALRPGEDWGGSEQFDGEAGARPGRRHRRPPGPRRSGPARRAARAVVRRRAARRHRPRPAVPAARRPGGRRRPHTAAARAGAARLGLPQAQQRRPAQAQPQGDAAARQGTPQGRRHSG